MRSGALMRSVALALGLGVLIAGDARAQYMAGPHRYLEYRTDAIIARSTALEGGLGLVVPFGSYVRVGVDGTAGTMWRDGSAHPAGRVDAIGRFLLDPFREVPVALSLGGGISVPYVEGERVRPYLTVVADLEGRMRGAFTPAVQLGLGGGARIGVVMRMSQVQWR